MIPCWIIEKPITVVSREREWADLTRFVSSTAARLGVVYGRRRLGKTHLIEHLATAANGLYFCAAQQPAAANLADLSAAVSTWLPRLRPIRYTSWDEALDHLLHLPRGATSSVLVFDEVGYLIDQMPSFPSLLQRALDRRPRPTQPLLLAGSTQSVMRRLTASGQPLRGRANLELVLDPFDFRDAASFWGVDRARVAVLLWSIVGGTPGYRELCDDEAPTSEASFPEWISRHVLSSSAALHREGRIVVMEEAALNDSAMHWAVLSAITSGATTRTAIGRAIGRPSTALGNSLSVLVSSGLIAREEDLLHRRRSSYRVDEPIVTTWKELVEPIERRMLQSDPKRLFDDIEAPFHARVVGPAFEQLVRDWAESHANESTLGGAVTAVGSSRVGRSPDDPNAAQIDLVAVDRDAAGRQTIRAIGEAKHRNRPIDMTAIARLEALRTRLDCPAAKLLLACDAGFDRDVVRADRRRADIELVDAERLLRGA